MENQNYVIDGDKAFSSPTAAMDWYKKQYYRLLEENDLLNQEISALVRQLHEAQL